MQTNPAVVEQN